VKKNEESEKAKNISIFANPPQKKHPRENKVIH
jgi:hypothetical protein